MNILADLFLTFAKIGCFTFGGGYAMITLIEDACVEKKKWITHDDMMNVAVIAESTPGPIAINCATFVGYRQGGFVGAVAATVGMVLPSFLIIFAVSQFLDHFLEIGWIHSAFMGIKLAVGILILDAGLTMLKKMKKKPFRIAIVIASLAAMMIINVFALQIRLLQGSVSQTINGLHMLARGDLRHYAAIYFMQFHLGRDAVRQNLASIAHQRHRSLVAGRFYSHNNHTFPSFRLIERISASSLGSR